MGMLTWLFETKKGFSGSIFGTWNREDLTDTLTLGNDQASKYRFRVRPRVGLCSRFCKFPFEGHEIYESYCGLERIINPYNKNILIGFRSV